MNIPEHPFLKFFDGRLIEKTCRQAQPRSYTAGSIIFKEGDSADSLFLVLSGVVEVSKKGGEKRITLAHYREGDYFGEMGLIDGGFRSARVTAKEDCSLAIVDKKMIEELFQRAPFSATQAILKQLSGSLRETNDRFVSEMVRKEKYGVVGEMAGSILHDLKNPLSSIQLGCDFIAEEHADSGTQQMCQLIRAQIRHMSGMIEEVLEFARGEQRLSRKETDMADVFQQIRVLNEGYFKERKIRFRVECEPIRLKIDEGKMIRVLQNLLSNSVAALEKRGGEIFLSVRKKEKGAEVVVQDDGSGIPEEIRHTLFEPFITHGKKNGTGLGLAIVRSVVEAHGGTIRVESEQGRGTAFIITLKE